MAIRVLDAAVVGRIAAGEVVERPASVVKELVENALDAGSSSITVEIKNGGIDYTRVTDNGVGIPAKEARIAFENHATSKISTQEELTDIRTLGFRGEALPSIAAVAKVTLTTRARGNDEGIRLQVNGSKVENLQPYGCPEGTTIVVRDLFYNVPVRHGFLKKASVEFGAVSDMIMRIILGNPQVSIRFINNERTVYHSVGDGNMRHAALSVYGRETAEKLVELDAFEGGLHIFGLIGVGDLSRANRSHQSFFVNGRVVRCQLLTEVLEEVCKSRVTIGRFPMCALHVTLPPHSVDVNVHPNKLEVRFRDEQMMRGGAEGLLAKAFEGERLLDLEQINAPEMQAPQTTVEIVKPPVENLTIEGGGQSQTESTGQPVVLPDQLPISNHPKPAYKPAQQQDKSLEQIEIPTIAIASNPSAIVRDPASSVVPLSVVEDTRENPPSNVEFKDQNAAHAPIHLRIIGVVFRTYVLVETEGALLMIDQHAAHERILYEQYKRQLEQGLAAQQLLAPMVVPVSAKEYSVLLDNRQLLLDVGYEVEPFGERDLQVRSVPHVLGKAEIKPVFAEMVDRLDLLRSTTIDRRRDEIIQASCKHAVKGGDALSEIEISSLIQEMQNTGSPPTCPHGRPVMRVFRRSELERHFKRIQ